MRKNRRVIIAYVIPTLLALFLRLSAEGESIWAQWDESRPQLEVRYLDTEIILSGKRKTPELYYLNMDRQPQLFGEYIAQGIALEKGGGLCDIGLCVWDGERVIPFVRTGEGALAVRGENGRVYAAAVDAESLYAGAEALLGYAPGVLDFQGNVCIKAALLWQGSQTEITAPAALRRIDEMLAALQPFSSGTSCPFDMILRLTFEDGTQADLFLATDSCDALFYHGATYEYSGKSILLELFDQL